jgi:ABC-type Fe3+-hydroxamate transport system substrate-binding protein
MQDQLRRNLTIKSTPNRIVCLVPSLTEMLVDIGLRDKLVGVTKFCVHPDDIRETATVIGGTKTLKIDKINSLKPDFILANKEENELESIEALAEKHLVYVSDIYSIEDLLQLIKDLGVIFNLPKTANFLIKDIQSNFGKFSNTMNSYPRLKVAYFIWREPWMVVGASTFITYMLELNNFENVYADLERYPEIQVEDLKPVDYVFLSSEPFPFKEQHKSELKLTPEHIRIVDGEYFSWYGSRLLKAFDYFLKLRESLQ